MNAEVEALVDAVRSRVAADCDLARFDLVSLVRPSIRWVAERVATAQIQLGASRIGGTPDLPPGIEWPRWAPFTQREDKFGEPRHSTEPAPLGFIAQIDLCAVPHVDHLLPRSGWLYFFYDRYYETWGYDPADRGSCRVVYANCDRASLHRVDPPADSDPAHTGHCCLVQARTDVTLPTTVPEGVEYGEPAFDAYVKLCDELENGGGSTIHRLLGHPQIVQNPMELECQLASYGIDCGRSDGDETEDKRRLTPGAADWRLLLQIDADEDGPGWMWGDVGRIYFWIRKQDLAARNFDDVWLILQCC